MKIKEWKYDDMMAKVFRYGDKWMDIDSFERTDDEINMIKRVDGFVTYTGRFEVIKETNKAVQVDFDGAWKEWMPKSAVVF